MNRRTATVNIASFHLMQRFRTQIDNRNQHIHTIQVLVNVPDDIFIQILTLFFGERLTNNQPKLAIRRRVTGVIH